MEESEQVDNYHEKNKYKVKEQNKPITWKKKYIPSF